VRPQVVGCLVRVFRLGHKSQIVSGGTGSLCRMCALCPLLNLGAARSIGRYSAGARLKTDRWCGDDLHVSGQYLRASTWIV
jgi:hypothetical protein